MSAENQNALFPAGNKAPAEYFTGTVWLNTLVPAGDSLNTIVTKVVFGPGARTHWHTHSGGQVLIVTDGVGYYQEKNMPVQVIKKGDVIQIAPSVIHWHGASRDKAMTHIAINPNVQKGLVDWLDPVSDEVYNNIK